MIWSSDGYDTGKMPKYEPCAKLSKRREHERGNIVLIAAILVLAFGGVGLGMARLVQAQMDVSTDMLLSNYGGTLAVNVAESAINQVLFNWNTGTVPPALGTRTNFPDLVTAYPRFAPSVITTRSTYSVVVDVPGAGKYRLTANATVSTDTGIRPSGNWRSINRRVVVIVNNAAPFDVTGYSR